MTDPEQRPITGQEDAGGLPDTLAALAAFYRAFNARDLALMSQNWAQAEDVAMDNPLGGITRGWEAIRGVYERIFGGPAEVRVEFFDYTLHETSEMFYAVGRERGYLRTDGMMIPLAIRTSRIFRRVAGQWRQVHHHGSMDDTVLLNRYQAAVTGASAQEATTFPDRRVEEAD